MFGYEPCQITFVSSFHFLFHSLVSRVRDKRCPSVLQVVVHACIGCSWNLQNCWVWEKGELETSGNLGSEKRDLISSFQVFWFPNEWMSEAGAWDDTHKLIILATWLKLACKSHKSCAATASVDGTEPLKTFWQISADTIDEMTGRVAVVRVTQPEYGQVFQLAWTVHGSHGLFF